MLGLGPTVTVKGRCRDETALLGTPVLIPLLEPWCGKMDSDSGRSRQFYFQRYPDSVASTRSSVTSLLTFSLVSLVFISHDYFPLTFRYLWTLSVSPKVMTSYLALFLPSNSVKE